MRIASEYAGLCLDPEVGERIHRLIAGEHQRSVEWILNVAELHTLVQENPALAGSLERRDALLGPLNYLQVSLIRRVREALVESPEQSPWLNALLRTINAIAAGMRNTG
jgi:phosphoenolpyruvate carboxylase